MAPAHAVRAAAVAEVKSNGVPEHDVPSNYVVQAGDTLSHLARRFNVKLKDLIVLNGIIDPNRIAVGTTLKIVR